MTLEELLPKEKAKGKWSKYVPVIKSGNTIDIYLTDEIIDPSEYNEACASLVSAAEDTNINIYLNTPGGMLDTAYQLVNAITDSKANITAILTGTVASAGTIIALACPRIVAKPHSTFMIHNYSMSSFGKGNELKQRQDYMNKHNVEAFNTFYKGFLTPKELKDMIEGKDFWLSDKEVIKRLEAKAAKAAKE